MRETPVCRDRPVRQWPTVTWPAIPPFSFFGFPVGPAQIREKFEKNRQKTFFQTNQAFKLSTNRLVVVVIGVGVDIRACVLLRSCALHAWCSVCVPTPNLAVGRVVSPTTCPHHRGHDALCGHVSARRVARVAFGVLVLTLRDVSAILPWRPRQRPLTRWPNRTCKFSSRH